MPNEQEQDHDPLIVITSNRGPFSFEAREDGSYRVRRGSGGLVTALSALAQKHDVLWVASAMSDDDRQWAAAHRDQIEEVEEIYLKLVNHNEEQYQKYYNIISNPLLWFIQHQLWDIPRSPTITRQTWDAWENGYRPINKGFAETIASSLAEQDPHRPVIIFVQDYHLYLVPHYLREIVGDRVQIQPFIHIPWPGPDAWRILPADIRTPMLASLLQSNRVGFQTEKDAFNFVQTCRFYLPGAHSHGSRKSIEYRGRLVEANAYPISVDVEKVKELAAEPQTQLLKSQLINFISDRRLILRVDRIEPSKNILRGLEAYRTLLEVHPEHRGKVQMLALLVPSRMEVDEYQDYLQQIMAQAGMINAEFSDAFWEPVRIVVGDNYHRAIGAMQFYDVLLVNPIADGMNLVAKEGVLVNQRDGVLLLSEHAGAFYELGQHALTVSSFDVYGTAQAMNHALTMPAVERQERAEALRAIVEKADVRRWFYDQLEDALA
jgi:trehalose 6-phosphate synthase